MTRFLRRMKNIKIGKKYRAFFDRHQQALLFAGWMGLIITASLAVVFLKAPLGANPSALGPHTLALFFPFLAAVFFLCVRAAVCKLSWKSMAALAILFVIPAAFFGGLLFQKISHVDGDDSFRYSLYAKNMRTHKTLWGGDILYQKDKKLRALKDVPAAWPKHYIDQPGFRYYLALTAFLFRGERRIMQLFNMFVFLMVLGVLLKHLRPRAAPLCFGGFLLMVFLTAPYTVKNILYGYTEWFTVLTAMIAGLFFLRKQWICFSITAALFPFIRQNMLIAAVVVFAMMIWHTRRFAYILIFLLILGLPVYHNLYYADEFRFFVTNRGALFAFHGDPLHLAMMLLRTMFSKGLDYFLILPPVQKPTQLIIAGLFLPLTPILLMVMALTAPLKKAALFAGIAAVTIGPTLIFGSCSYPRFEYTNLYVLYVVLVCFYANKQGVFSGE